MEIKKIEPTSGVGDKEPFLPRFGQLFQKMQKRRRSEEKSPAPNASTAVVSPGHIDVEA